MTEQVTIVSLGTAIISVLCSVIFYLWKILNAHFEEIKKNLEDCEKKHAEALTSLLSLTKQMGEMSGKISVLEIELKKKKYV